MRLKRFLLRNRTYLFLKSLFACLWYLAYIFTSSKRFLGILDTDYEVDILRDALFFNTFSQSVFDYLHMHFLLLLGTLFFLEKKYSVKYITTLLVYWLNMPLTLLKRNPNKDFFHIFENCYSTE